MIKNPCVVFGVAVLTFVISSYRARPLWAEGSQRRSVIIQPINETRLVTLAGNTRFDAKARNDRGRVPDDLPLDHMLLQLKRPADLEREFGRDIDSLTDKSSPNFRHWMTAAEQGEKYGLAQEDLDAITRWLEAHHFTVGYVYPNRMVIDFSGTASQIREAFHTEIHYLEARGERHIANMSDPQIPEALAPAVKGVVSLHDFRPHGARKPRPGYTFSGECGIPCFYPVPADFQTIYNLTPLYTAGIYGQGQTVALIEDSNSYGNDWSTYQKKFGLTSYGGTLTTVHPNSGGNCTNPGTNANDEEADIDVEMVTALAPGANAEVASCADTGTTFGGLIAIENLISAGNPPAVMSLSYQECEVANGATGNAAFNSAFQSAAAAGVSVFGITGDHGPSLCSEDFDAGENEYEYALSGLGVNGLGETAYNVSVGGTDFEAFYNAFEGGPPLSTYFGTNGPTYGSAKSYIPEIPWDYSCATYLLYTFYGDAAYGPGSLCNMDHFPYDAPLTWAAGGGPSGCATGAGNNEYGYIEDTTCAGYSKPSWQSGIFGNPADGVRDVPDVSLFAACNTWNSCQIFCWSDVEHGGTSCSGAPNTWSGASGTSFSAPLMAAIQSLVNQKWNTRVGNPNPTYYAIANSEFGSSGNRDCYSINLPGATNCVFNDITQGDIDLDCEPFDSAFRADCYDPAGTFGALGTQAISSLTLTSGGSGYTGTPTCTIVAPSNLSPYVSPTGTTIYAGGIQATCTATVDKTTKAVSKVTLTNQGQGYTGVPLCTLSGGGGSGATCYAVIDPTTRAAAYQPAFGATPGWDMATGLGSVNAYNLVNDSAWK